MFLARGVAQHVMCTDSSKGHLFGQGLLRRKGAVLHTLPHTTHPESLRWWVILDMVPVPVPVLFRHPDPLRHGLQEGPAGRLEIRISIVHAFLIEGSRAIEVPQSSYSSFLVIPGCLRWVAARLSVISTGIACQCMEKHASGRPGFPLVSGPPLSLLLSLS